MPCREIYFSKTENFKAIIYTHILGLIGQTDIQTLL